MTKKDKVTLEELAGLVELDEERRESQKEKKREEDVWATQVAQYLKDTRQAVRTKVIASVIALEDKILPSSPTVLSAATSVLRYLHRRNEICRVRVGRVFYWFHSDYREDLTELGVDIRRFGYSRKLKPGR